MIKTINSDFRDVDWDGIDLQPDRAFSDVPSGVFARQSGNPYSPSGRMVDVEKYDDSNFPHSSLASHNRRHLPKDGLALIGHLPEQTEAVVEAHRAEGFRADYGYSITLHFDASGRQGMGPLYTTNQIAHNKKTITIAEGPEHEWDYEYVYNCIDYPRQKRDVDWHPSQMHQGTVEYILESFGGECWVDFTAGTGTLGLAAKELGKDAILVERDPDYYEKMVDRVESYRPQTVADPGEW